MKRLLRPTRFASRVRRVLIRVNLAVLILLAAAILMLVNHLTARYVYRWHCNRDPQSQLSTRTKQILGAVSEELQIFVLMRPAHEAHARTIRLLREYAAMGANVTVHEIDPDRQLAETEELLSRYRLEAEEAIVFDLAGRHQAVPADTLLDIGYPDNTTGLVRRAFRGEALCSGAILALTQSARPLVYFVQGHGERSPLDYDRRAGASRIATRLRECNLDVDILHLSEAKSIPSHCALLIVAGPVREFTPYEIALLRDYLDRKGRLLALLDARVGTGLESLLQTWGVQLGEDVVVDPARTLTGRELYVTVYQDHPITAPLQGLTSIFYHPRSIRSRPMSAGADKPAFAVLAASSSQGWAEFSPDETTPHYDPPVDILGPVPVAVAIERGPVPGVHVQIRPTRLVVVGDSAFMSNGGLTGANADFFLNCVNWLLDREDLLAVSPALLDDYQVLADSRQLRGLFLAIVAGLPALAALAGGIVAWRRRR